MAPDRIPTRLAGLALRSAGRSDAALVLGLVQRLAAYENLSHEVVASVADFERWLFGERPCAEAVIAELDGTPAGFVLWFTTFSTFVGRPGIHVEDLFVLPELRGRGIGKSLLAWVARTACERGCARLEWSVLDWNEPARRFYDSIGAELKTEWLLERLTGQHLERLAGVFPAAREPLPRSDH